MATEGEFIEVSEPAVPTAIENFSLCTAINPDSRCTASLIGEPYKHDGETEVFYGMEADNSKKWENPYYDIEFSSEGYDNIKFSARLGATKKGPKNYTLSYSTDGGKTFLEAGKYSIMKNKVMEHAFCDVVISAANCTKVILRIAADGAETVGGEVTLTSAPYSGSCAISDIAILANKTQNYIKDALATQNGVTYTVTPGANAFDGTTYVCAYNAQTLENVFLKSCKVSADCTLDMEAPIKIDSASVVKIMLFRDNLEPFGVPLCIPCV